MTFRVYVAADRRDDLLPVAKIAAAAHFTDGPFELVYLKTSLVGNRYQAEVEFQAIRPVLRLLDVVSPDDAAVLREHFPEA